jgi:predicted nucleic-acid-binding protein
MGPAEAVKSVDTNVLARFLLNDDPSQSPIARSIIAEGVVVPITVLLELGWLLGSRMGMDRPVLNLILVKLLGMPGIHIDNEPQIRAALALHAKGADFADAIHLVAARGSEAFVTFDRQVPDGDGIGVDVERVGLVE